MKRNSLASQLKKLIILITIVGCITVGCNNKKDKTEREDEENQGINLADYDSIPQGTVLKMSEKYLDSAKLNPDSVITKFIVMDGDLLKKIIDKKKRIKLISAIDINNNLTAVIQLMDDEKYRYYDIKVFCFPGLPVIIQVCPFLYFAVIHCLKNQPGAYNNKPA